MTDLRAVPSGEAELARLHHELGRLGARAAGRRSRLEAP